MSNRYVPVRDTLHGVGTKIPKGLDHSPPNPPVQDLDQAVLLGADQKVRVQPAVGHNRPRRRVVVLVKPAVRRVDGQLVQVPHPDVAVAGSRGQGCRLAGHPLEARHEAAVGPELGAGNALLPFVRSVHKRHISYKTLHELKLSYVSHAINAKFNELRINTYLRCRQIRGGWRKDPDIWPKS